MSAEQRALPVSFERPLPPRLPEPRVGEPAGDYTWRCIAVAQRYWEEWYARQRAGREGDDGKGAIGDETAVGKEGAGG